MSSNAAIRAENLSKCYHIYDRPRDRLRQMLSTGGKKRYREFWALEDVSFEVKKGETVGIIGRNGSGKSTLLQLICGTLNPSNGSVVTDGRITALLELGAGFNPEFTGRENVYMNASLYGLPKREIDGHLANIIEFADIGDFVDQPVKTYSSGMYVRLAFAIHANLEPDIFIIDEALAVGDAQFVHKCMLRLNELQDRGATILFVSHDVGSVRSLCSRAIWLANGRVRQCGDSPEVVDAYLADIFRMQVVDAASSQQGAAPAEGGNRREQNLETEIPNIDRRLGNQRCEIMGIGLYDESMHRITSTFNEEQVILRVTVRNRSLSRDSSLSAGYIFKNSKGQEIASANSLIEGKKIVIKKEAEVRTVSMKVTLPCLYPGSYSFTVSVSQVQESGETVLLDRIDNAVIFDVLSRKKVHVLMSFPTKFECA